MEQRAASVFDTCLEQALQQAEPLMVAMGNAALASLHAKLLDPGNANIQLLLQDALAQLKSKKVDLPASYSQRLRQAAFLIAEGKRADYHQLMGGHMADDGLLESEVLRTQIEWGRVQINLLQQTEQSLIGLERVYRPLRKITLHWRNGNPLHHTIYLDSLQAALHDQRISTDVTSLFLADMVGVMADHLQINYRRIMSLAMNSYSELLAKAEAKRVAAKDSNKSFARRARQLFVIPESTPVGAVRAYKALIPVLDRLSTKDASFWDDASHPARLLLQTIVDKALTLKEQGGVSSYPQFPRLVSESVAVLSSIKYPTADDFAKALARFGVPVKPRAAVVAPDSMLSGYSSSMLLDESHWGASELMSVLPESVIAAPVSTTLKAQAAETDAQAVFASCLERMEQDVMASIAMSRHSIDADPTVLAALSSVWPKVLAQTAQRAGEDSPSFRAYRQVVPEVLALVGANAGVGLHSDADVLIPSLLTRLKSGLASIGWMPERMAPVLTAVAHMAPSAIVELEMEQEDEVLVPAPALDLQLDASIVQASEGLPPSASVQPASLAPESPALAATPANTKVGLRISGRLVEGGVWFEFFSQGIWVAKELSWINPQATMFMFRAEDGSTQSMTRRILEKLAQEQTVRAK